MRAHRVAAAVLASLSCALLAASCIQSQTEAPEAAGVESPAGTPGQERTGEAVQPAYEDLFRFVVEVKDDGRGKAGGWQKATTTMKFGDARHALIPYLWQCPIQVGMPIRAELQGRISPEYAAKITAEVATSVTRSLMHSRESWEGQGAVFCIDLYDRMKKALNGPPYLIGATVRRP